MIEHTLRECFTTRMGTQISSETERFIHRQVSFDGNHGGSRRLILFENVSSPPVQDRVDTTSSVLWALNFNQVNRFQKPGLGSQNTVIQDSSSCGNDLTTNTLMLFIVVVVKSFPQLEESCMPVF